LGLEEKKGNTLAYLTVVYSLVIFAIVFVFSISSYVAFSILVDNFVASDLKQELRYVSSQNITENTRWLTFSDESIAVLDQRGSIISLSRNFPSFRFSKFKSGFHLGYINGKKIMYIRTLLPNHFTVIVARNMTKFESIKKKLLSSFILALVALSIIISFTGFFIAK
jgi:two-component system OmpR family sensor kinase